VLRLKDAGGNTVEVTAVIPSTVTIVSITLSDESTVDLQTADMQTLMGLDVSKIVSVTDSDGKVYDLSAYTISTSTPTMPNGDSGNGEGIPSVQGNQGENGMNNSSTPNGQGDTGDTMPSIQNGNGENETSSGGQNGSSQQNGFPNGNNQGQIPNGNGQLNPDVQPGMTDATSENEKWILVGISVLVLAVGVFFAIKKKY